MENESANKSIPASSESSNNIIKPALITFVVFIAVGISVLVGFKYSQSKSGGMVLPAGTTYLGLSPTPQQPKATPVPKFTADATVPYKDYFGALYPFSFSYPETLTLVTFADNPPKDTIAIVWANIPPQQNILLDVEQFKNSNITKQEYVENWWKNFSGLKSVASVVPFTNVKGLKGYKAHYVNQANESPNIDVFFEVPDRPDIMIHLANGMLDATIFDKIVDTLSWNTTTPSPTP